MKRFLGRTLEAILLVAVAMVVVILAYALYVLVSYSRIPDNLPVEIQNNNGEILQRGTNYTLLSYNIGYGAYIQDFSFFMDSGTRKDGKNTRGFFGRAVSPDHVRFSLDGVEGIMKSLGSDFVFLQEVDTDSTRSFHLNQVEEITAVAEGYASAYAVNFHSSWLNLPLYNPHGVANSGILTLSRYKTTDAIRRSYPITESLDKVTDLDRCFLITRHPVAGGKELVLINHHMSAYDKGGVAREKQLRLITGVLEEEYRKGNYVIFGGDFNHSLGEEFLGLFHSEEQTPEWIAVIKDEDIPLHYSIVKPQNGFESATCRNADMPYSKGKTYLCTIDGFIVSDNMVFSSRIIDTDFLYSDHNPVVLDFILL